MAKGPVPVLVSVTDCDALVTPTGSPAKDKLLADRDTAGGVRPVPDSAMLCGEPLALSVMVTAAVSAPVVAGVKWPWMAQFAPAATLVPQLFANTKEEASAPVTAMLVMVKGPVPVLVSVTDCDALVAPGLIEPNERLVAERVTAGAPVSVTVTVTMLEVEAGYVLLPENVAVTELAPDWSADPATVSLQVPLLNVQLPSVVVPALKVAVPPSAGGVSTYPVGVLPVTVAVRFVDWLEVREVSDAESAVVLPKAVFHLVMRLFTFTEPRPVAESKPGAAG